MQLAQRIAAELNIKTSQATAAIELLDEGATVPFISRYRKEVTQGLDDTQLRNLEERLRYIRELDQRRQSILDSIEEQGKLSDELNKQILDADTKTMLGIGPPALLLEHSKQDKVRQFLSRGKQSTRDPVHEH